MHATDIPAGISQDPTPPDVARARSEVARLTRELNYQIEAAYLVINQDAAITVSQHPLGRGAPSVSVRLTDRPLAGTGR